MPWLWLWLLLLFAVIVLLVVVGLQQRTSVFCSHWKLYLPTKAGLDGALPQDLRRELQIAGSLSCSQALTSTRLDSSGLFDLHAC